MAMEQLCATLQAWQSAPAVSGGGGGRGRMGSVRDAMLLALRGVSLSGGSIGGGEASRFRQVGARAPSGVWYSVLVFL